MSPYDNWVPVYPKSVKYNDGLLLDEVTGKTYQADKSIISELEKIDGKKNLKTINKGFSWLAFLEMNEKGLLNFEIPFGHRMLIWLKHLIALFGVPVEVFIPNFRFDPPKNSFSKIFTYLFIIILKKISLLLIPILVPSVIFFSLLKFLPGILIVAFMTGSVVLSITIHEFAHIFTLYKNKKTKNFFILVSGIFSMSIVKPEGCPRKEALAAAAGPLSTAIISLLLIIISLYLSKTLKVLMVLESLVFGLMSFSILPFFVDGKIVFAYINGRDS